MKYLLLFLTTTLFALNVNFEKDKIGVYTKKEWKKDFKKPIGYKSSGIPKKWLYIQKMESKVLRILYKKGLSNKGGSKFRVKTLPLDKATLKYDVMFEKGFNFNKGGKLPGLGGGKAQTGGHNSKDGFSVRLMWYSKGTKGSIKDTSKANLFAYLYYPLKKEKYGENINLNTLIIPNKWYHIKIYVKLNDIGKQNGILKIWVNKKLVLYKNNFVFRINNIHIDQFLFHTFFGGHGKKWASPKNQYSYFDNIYFSGKVKSKKHKYKDIKRVF